MGKHLNCYSRAYNISLHDGKNLTHKYLLIRDELFFDWTRELPPEVNMRLVAIT